MSEVHAIGTGSSTSIEEKWLSLFEAVQNQVKISEEYGSCYSQQNITSLHTDERRTSLDEEEDAAYSL